MPASASAPLFLTAPGLAARGVVHGFSLRAGGVSRGPFESLNLSAAVGDAPEAVAQNLARLGQAAGLQAEVATVHQVHQDRVLAARAGGELREVFAASEPAAQGSSGEVGAGSRPAADALISAEPGAPVGIRVADCVPVLIFDPDSGAAAAVHSGWRGTRLEIAARTVRALAQVAGSDPARLLAAVGPCIGACCYAVSADLADQFATRFGPQAVRAGEGGAPHLDLRHCVLASLAQAGLARANLELVGGCTACSPALYFSHRRDQGRSGRHLAFIEAVAR